MPEKEWPLKLQNEIDKHGWHSFKQKMTVIQEVETLMRIHNLIEGGSWPSG